MNKKTAERLFLEAACGAVTIFYGGLKTGFLQPSA
ncbi:hypothetical protein ABMB67_004396 [Halalkalibacter oceani]